MADLDGETIERAVRWCAEAGRQTTAREVRAALEPLGWDQLLAVRALLADPPPTRPLGPLALADLSRGVEPEVAAQRERERPDQVPALVSPGADAATPPAGPRAGATPRKATRPSRRAQVVVRKAATAAPPEPPAPARLPLFEELLLPAGRAELERLIRRHGGRRPRLVAAIAATHRRADGAAVGDAELDAALEHHGLERAFERRERDELLHSVRAAGAVLGQAAAALGHEASSLAAAISRLGLEADVKRLREARRRDLRARATLAERAQLLVGSADRLADLELLEEFERDLKKRLPEHLRALAGTGVPLELGLTRSLSLPATALRPLLERLGVELRTPPPGPIAAAARPHRERYHPPARTSAARATRPIKGGSSGQRPAPGRPAGGRPAASGVPQVAVPQVAVPQVAVPQVAVPQVAVP